MKDCCLFIQRDKKAQTRDRLSHGFIERGDTSEEFCGCSLILLQGMRSKYSSTKKKLKGKKKKKKGTMKKDYQNVIATSHTPTSTNFLFLQSPHMHVQQPFLKSIVYQ